MLHLDVRGRGSRVVLVHGFTQTGRSWDHVAGALAARHQVVTVDGPGHGRSAAERPRDLPEAARMLAGAGGTAAYVGYSMGGRLALRLAVDHPYRVTRLVLVGATAGLDSDADRAGRRASDEELADRLEHDGVDAFLDRWLDNPLFATLPRAQAGLDERRHNSAEALAWSLRTLGTGMQEPLWDRLAALAMPVLVVAGARDEKFASLGRRLVEAIGPNAHLELVPGAGHAVHLERPEAFLAVVAPFLGDERRAGAVHEAASPNAKSSPNSS